MRDERSRENRSERWRRSRSKPTVKTGYGRTDKPKKTEALECLKCGSLFEGVDDPQGLNFCGEECNEEWWAWQEGRSGD